MVLKNRYISLKTAAKVSGYAPDYISYLIRKGKIRGKKIYNNISWQIAPEEIINYCRKTNHLITPDPVLLEKKYLFLKEAAQISGYAPDYIGYLIRQGKIKGEKVYSGVSWLTTEKAIKNYQKLITKKQREKENAFVLKYLVSGIKSSFGFSSPKTTITKFFGVGWRLSLATFILLLLFGINPVEIFRQLVGALGGKEQTVNLYTSVCTGDWQNPNNAEGPPEVGADGNINLFSETNSAVYKNGPLYLICEKFTINGEQLTEPTEPKGGEPTTLSPPGESGPVIFSSIDYATPSTESAIAMIESAVSSIESATPSTKLVTTPINNDTFLSAKIKFSFSFGEKTPDILPIEQQALPSFEEQNLGGQETIEESLPEIEPIETATPPIGFLDKIKNFFRASIAKAQEYISAIDTTTPPVDTIILPSIENVASSPETVTPPVEGIVMPNLDAKIIIWYSFDGEVWWQLDTISSSPLSNFQVGGYFEYDTPFLKNWQDIENLKIKFEGVVGGETTLTAYLDGVWVEAKYEEKERPENPKKLPKIKIKDNSLFFSQLQENFSINEEPIFVIEEPELPVEELVNLGKAEILKEEVEIPQTQEKRGLLERTEKFIEGLVDTLEEKVLEPIIEPIIQQILPNEVKAQINKIKAQTFSPDGTTIDTSSKIHPLSEDEKETFEVKIPKNNKREFRPGIYRLELEFETNEAIYILEQDFTWGVLAINTNKSIYLPNERVYLQMVALRSDGHTICDANLKLEITAPSGDRVSADIQKSGECGPNNVTNVPDYFAYYQVGEPGTYEMKLKNLDNGYEIEDSFEVRESISFDVERIGPTRIYPPATYQMLMKIKANQDFNGQVIESVPASFEIIEAEQTLISTPNNAESASISVLNQRVSASIVTEGETKQIIWNVTWRAGEEYELRYQFDAPDISPLLYLLGPLTFMETGSPSVAFEEARQWQIAADAITRGATISTYVTSSTVTTVSEAHTVDAGTTLLILVISQEAQETLVAEPYWNTTEAFTLIHASTSSGLGGDVHNFIYGLVNPTAGTHNITYESSSNDNIHHTAINYLGTISSSVADATNYLNETVNNSGTGSTILASGGSSGNTLLAAGVFRGGDGDPSTNNAGFYEIADAGTGASILSDIAFYVADLIGGAPSAVTITWNASDENAGQLIEILPAATTVSGNIYQSNETSAYNCLTNPLTVDLKVNGAGTYSTTCTLATGDYSISGVSASTNDIITVFINENTTPYATTVTKYNTGDITDLNLYVDHLITRAETGSLTNANLGLYDNDNDTDIVFTSNSNALSVETGNELLVWTGDTFAPGGTITADFLKLQSSATLNTANNMTIGNISTASGDIANSGTISQTAGTTLVQSSSGDTFYVGGGATFYNFQVGVFGSGSIFTCTLAGAITVSNDLTIRGGTVGQLRYLDVSASNHGITVGGSWTASDGENMFIPQNGTVTFTSTGAETISNWHNFYNITFNGSGGSWIFNYVDTTIENDLLMWPGTLDSAVNLTVNGFVKGWILYGTINITNAVTFTNNVSANEDFGASGGSPAWTFYNLTFQSATGTPTITHLGNAINVTNDFTAGDGSTITINDDTYDSPFDVGGNFTIASNATFQASASASLNAGGSWSNSGTFTHSSATVTFDATTTGKTINAGSSSFNNVIFNGSGGAWSPLTNTMTVAGNLTMTNGTFNTSSGTANVTANGNVQCGATCGTINMTSTNTFTNSVATSTSFATNVATSTAWSFYNLTFESATSTPTITFNSTGTGAINVNNNLTLTNSGTSLTVDNDTNDRTLDVDGNVSIGANTVLDASSSASFNVGGAWANSGTFTHHDGTVTFNATSTGKTLSGTLNGSSAFYQVAFNGSGGGWAIEDPMLVTATTTSALDISAGTVTLGNGDGDDLEVRGKFLVATDANETATFQTYPSLAEGESITLNVNATSTPSCANCIISVGASSGSGSGQFLMDKNVTLQFNSGASVESGLEVESTGYLEIKGDQESGTPLETVTHDAGATITLTDTVKSWTANDHQNKHVRITATSSLAFGKIYTISSNATTTLTFTDDYDTEDSGASISGDTVTTSVSLISANDEGIGQYIYNTTDNEYYLIVDSTENGTTDSIVIISTPDTVPGSLSGKTIKIADGIKVGDEYEILDYATVTAEATNHGYIYSKSGSETKIQYADISELGANVANKYGIYANSVDASNSNEGIKINKSRIHDGYRGVYLGGSSNNNTANSAGFTDNALYSNSSQGIYLNTSSNNILSSNTSYSNTSYGIIIYLGSNNTLSSNTFYSTTYGIYLNTSSNNILSSNTSYSNTSYGIIIYLGSNNTLSSNTFYSTTYGIFLSLSSNNILFSNTSYSNTEGLRSVHSTGTIIINDDYGVSGANSTADIVFNDSTSVSNLKLFNVDLASTTEVSGVTHTGAYVISEKHDTSTGSVQVWGEYTVPDDNSETPQDEGTQKFNYANNLWEDSATAAGYSGTGTEDTDIQITLTSALSVVEWYRAEVTTANGDTPIFTITRSGGIADPSTYTLPGTYTEASTGVRFTIQDGATNYVVGDTYTFVVWPKSNDTNTQKILAVQQADDKITVGSGETFELKGGGASSSDISQITSAASALWDLSITGTTTVQEATINYLNLNSGDLTVFNTTLNNEDTPDAGTNLYVDWYLGVHVVDATATSTNIDTGADEVTISENSTTPTSTVWIYNSGSWGSPSTSQTTETDSNGLIPQPGNNDAIRIREYTKTSTATTYYKYNLAAALQPQYGPYDYYDDQGNNYITSTLNTGSGEDESISENWQRDDIDANNTEPALDQPPTNGTWYIGMLPMLTFSIDSASVAFDELNTANNFTDTKTSTLTITSSADSGYVVTAWSTQVMTHTSYPSQTISDWTGTNATPTAWGTDCPDNGSYCGFGYNTDDDNLSGGTSNRFSGSKYAAFTHSGSGDPVSDYTSATTSAQHVITYKTSINTLQAAGDYQTTVVYVCTAQY